MTPIARLFNVADMCKNHRKSMRAVDEKLIINELGPNCRSGGTVQQMKHTAHGVGVQHINITVISCGVNSEYLSIFTAHAPSNLKHVKHNLTPMPPLFLFSFVFTIILNSRRVVYTLSLRAIFLLLELNFLVL